MKKLFLFAAILFPVFASFACTTFFLNKDGHYYFGRNYDWVTGNGMVMVNARNVEKVSAGEGKLANWTSKYGSISFNQYGKEFPTGGMNEKGLVVELMWLDETIYPQTDARPAFGVLQWIQYQLDKCATVEEVIATDKNIRISNTGNAPLHYLVADAAGNVATIEFLNGKMVVHKGKELLFPVLTNSVYAESIGQTRSVVDKKESIQFNDNSIQRFALACSMVNKFNEAPDNNSPVDYGFSILNAVAQGSHTKWSIMYDITDKKIHFFTNDYKQKKTVSFSAFDFACANQKAFEMNQSLEGDVSKNFKKLTYEDNKNLVEKSALQSRSAIEISTAAIEEAALFFNKPRCR